MMFFRTKSLCVSAKALVMLLLCLMFLQSESAEISPEGAVRHDVAELNGPAQTFTVVSELWASALHVAMYEGFITIGMCVMTYVALSLFQNKQKIFKKSHGIAQFKAPMSKMVTSSLEAEAHLPARRMSGTSSTTMSETAPIQSANSEAGNTSDKLAFSTKTFTASTGNARDGAIPGSRHYPPRRTQETDAYSAAVRAGRAEELPALLKCAIDRMALKTEDVAWREEDASRHLLAALRACAAARRFQSALTAYSSIRDHIGNGCQAIWSLLLYSSAQVGDYDACWPLFEKLCAQGHPSSHDAVNMMQCLAARHDISGLQRFLQHIRESGSKLDSITRNRALAACTASDAMTLAETMLQDDTICEEPPDAIAYNTVMKGYSRAGQPARCFEVRRVMEAKGLQPSQITFGILLDACVNSQDHQGLKEAFKDLQASGVELNKVHYTSLIKGLVSAGHCDEAEKVLHQMQQSTGAKPDLITYSTVIKAYVDRTNMASSLRIFRQMLLEGIMPDEVVFRSLLLGCVAKLCGPLEVVHIFDDLVQHGLKPSDKTISILVKALLQMKSLQTSLDILREAPERHGFIPETRLHMQVVRACIGLGEQGFALEAFDEMHHAAQLRGETLENCVYDSLVQYSEECRAFRLAKSISARRPCASLQR